MPKTESTQKLCQAIQDNPDWGEPCADCPTDCTDLRGVRQELTEEDIIYNHFQYARAMSDAQLQRHYSISTSGGDTCGECFCCICGKVLKEREG